MTLFSSSPEAGRDSPPHPKTLGTAGKGRENGEGKAREGPGSDDGGLRLPHLLGAFSAAHLLLAPLPALLARLLPGAGTSLHERHCPRRDGSGDIGASYKRIWTPTSRGSRIVQMPGRCASVPSAARRGGQCTKLGFSHSATAGAADTQSHEHGPGSQVSVQRTRSMPSASRRGSALPVNRPCVQAA